MDAETVSPVVVLAFVALFGCSPAGGGGGASAGSTTGTTSDCDEDAGVVCGETGDDGTGDPTPPPPGGQCSPSCGESTISMTISGAINKTVSYEINQCGLMYCTTPPEGAGISCIAARTVAGGTEDVASFFMTDYSEGKTSYTLDKLAQFSFQEKSGNPHWCPAVAPADGGDVLAYVLLPTEVSPETCNLTIERQGAAQVGSFNCATLRNVDKPVKEKIAIEGTFRLCHEDLEALVTTPLCAGSAE